MDSEERCGAPSPRGSPPGKSGCHEESFWMRDRTSFYCADFAARGRQPRAPQPSSAGRNAFSRPQQARQDGRARPIPPAMLARSSLCLSARARNRQLLAWNCTGNEFLRPGPGWRLSFGPAWNYLPAAQPRSAPGNEGTLRLSGQSKHPWSWPTPPGGVDKTCRALRECYCFSRETDLSLGYI